MDTIELAEHLEKHQRWLRREKGGVRANLYRANLSEANLSEANLSEANLYRADLSGANLSGADLSEADLTGVRGLLSITPETGAFEGYKKLRNGAIAHIFIPASAKRVGGFTSRKCRAESAVVLAIWDKNGAPVSSGLSAHDPEFAYTVGNTVRPDTYSDDPRLVCAPGIHFYLSRREAEEHRA